ncbi:MAG TPA: 16S rRNA (guanine(527)-N(7))-methyltransferase RsmG [Burkholderiaceae bacterium]
MTAAETQAIRLARLRSAAATLQLSLPERDAQRLLAYLDLLQRWNGTYNLTAVRDPNEMLVQHLFDCLAVIPPLQRTLAAVPHPRVLDVGSGGGLPGVVIAMLLPAVRVVCVDTVGKKAAFIRQAGVELQLPNLQAEHGRVESLRAEPFDLITSRAFASLADFTRLTQRHLANPGIWAAMKGKRPDDEIAALPAEVTMFHVEPLHVPELNAERCLVWMRRRPD